MPISRIEKSVARLGNNAVYGDGSDGDVIITNDGATILEKMEIHH
jgi:chaperonin GroEL (HSP60 family)